MSRRFVKSRYAPEEGLQAIGDCVGVSKDLSRVVSLTKLSITQPYMDVPSSVFAAGGERNNTRRRPMKSLHQYATLKRYHMISGTFFINLWINVADRMGASAFAPEYVLQRPPRRQHRQILVYRRDASSQANKDINNNPMALKTR